MAEAKVLALINPLFRQIKVRSIDSFFFYHYGYLLLVIVLFSGLLALGYSPICGITIYEIECSIMKNILARFLMVCRSISPANDYEGINLTRFVF